MGLIDQVLGQVIGSMTGGARGREAGDTTGGGLGDIIGQVLGRGDAQASGRMQAPPGSDVSSRGGGIGDLLGGLGGRLSPLILAALAVLASKHLGSGAGGLGSILRDAIGGGRSRRSDGAEEDDPTLRMPGGFDAAPGEDPGVPYDDPVRDYGPRGSDGFLEEIGSMLDGPRGPARDDGGFGDLQRRFDESGQGDLMGSWIGPGANRVPSPDELERALGRGTVDDLARRFGLERGELLNGLTQALPRVVDGLTPQGRTPSAEDRRGWV